MEGEMVFSSGSTTDRGAGMMDNWGSEIDVTNRINIIVHPPSGLESPYTAHQVDCEFDALALQAMPYQKKMEFLDTLTKEMGAALGKTFADKVQVAAAYGKATLRIVTYAQPSTYKRGRK
jgi:hypothetical protein